MLITILHQHISFTTLAPPYLPFKGKYFPEAYGKPIAIDCVKSFQSFLESEISWLAQWFSRQCSQFLFRHKKRRLESLSENDFCSSF
jgi:hypothetical protein